MITRRHLTGIKIFFWKSANWEFGFFLNILCSKDPILFTVCFHCPTYLWVVSVCSVRTMILIQVSSVVPFVIYGAAVWCYCKLGCFLLRSILTTYRSAITWFFGRYGILASSKSITLVIQFFSIIGSVTKPGKPVLDIFSNCNLCSEYSKISKVCSFCHSDVRKMKRRMQVTRVTQA